ncbi:MAG: glutamate--tRNA ligase [Actinomycetia bacterium]|nr:glutamate--tRNA ligase [Actinomycetes bacterium]
MTDTPRVRFAPAPTGYLHVGSARAALYNWLFARSTGGSLVLRIEDTDTERNKPELIEAILDALRWLGIDWDEGPVYQSERFEMYRNAAQTLLDSGRAYLVDADDNRVEGTALVEGLAVRYQTPNEGSTSWPDIIRGNVTFEHEHLEDFVVWRSNQTPTFLLANAVDDVDLGITHVVRGEDLVNATPKVLLVREALGHPDQPVFAHLPLLVNEQRKKLSKRRDDVSVGDYRDRGYLPEAMVNYLALLGWGPKDEVEVRPIAEIISLFKLEDVNPAAAFFDLKKLDHINAEYLRAMDTDTFVDAVDPWLADAPWAPEDFKPDTFKRMVPEIQKRVSTLSEAPGWVDFLFLPEAPTDQEAWDKNMDPDKGAVIMLDGCLEAFATCDWTVESLYDTTFGVGEQNGLNKKKSQMPVRIALTGRAAGPPLFESMVELGRDETVRRLQVARGRVG